MTPEQIARYEAFPRPVTGDGGWISDGRIVIDRFDDSVCDMHGDYDRTVLDERAALIAAAPDMRDAIDVLLAEVTRLRGELDDANRYVVDVERERDAAEDRADESLRRMGGT